MYIRTINYLFIIFLLLVPLQLMASDHKGTTSCLQVITQAKNPKTGEVRTFPTPCDVPSGWIIVPNLSTLSSFVMIPQAQGHFKLTWKTFSEWDNAGFFIWRALKEGNGYQDIHKISQLIPAEGNLIGGASYSYQDIITDFKDELVYC